MAAPRRAALIWRLAGSHSHARGDAFAKTMRARIVLADDGRFPQEPTSSTIITTSPAMLLRGSSADGKGGQAQRAAVGLRHTRHDSARADSARTAGHSDPSSKPGGLAPVAACHAAAAPRWATTRDTAAPTANETDHTSASRHRTPRDAGFAGGSSCRLARQTAVIPQRKAAAAAAPDANATTSHIRRRTPNSFPTRTLYNRMGHCRQTMLLRKGRTTPTGTPWSRTASPSMPKPVNPVSSRVAFIRAQAHERTGSASGVCTLFAAVLVRAVVHRLSIRGWGAVVKRTLDRNRSARQGPRCRARIRASSRRTRRG
jgi:hypothetical protein